MGRPWTHARGRLTASLTDGNQQSPRLLGLKAAEAAVTGGRESKVYILINYLLLLPATEGDLLLEICIIG